MLKRKIMRDMIEYKVQFISIFLMAFIGVLVFTGMYMDTTNFETTLDDYYQETNLADGWIYSNYLVDEFVEQVYLLGATTQMERQLVVDSQAKLENTPDITLHFVENNTISKFYLIEGNELEINDSEGVWLDKSFADERNLRVGDKITFESNGIEITKVIRGLGYSPEYVYNSPAATTVPDYNSTGFAYLSHEAFPSDNITYNVLNVKFDGTPETYSKLLDYRLNGYYSTFLEKDNHYSVKVIDDSISQQKSLSAVFPSIFIFISLLMLLTTMKRIISHQRTEIGILKANGFKNRKIAWHYMIPGFLLITLGATLGSLLGPIIFHEIANPSRIFYFKFPYWHYTWFINSLILIPIMGVFSLIVSYHSIESIVNESPSSTIRPKAPKNATLSFFERLEIWKKIPFTFRWNFRNIKRKKMQSMLTIFGIIGCTLLLISGLGLFEQMNESKDWYFNDVNHFESKLIIDKNSSISEIDAIAQEVNGDEIMESTIEITNNKTEAASLMVLNNTDLITPTDDNHDKIEIGNDEVSISRKMADIMNVNVGDTIDFHILGSDKHIKVKIDKMHSSPFSQGLIMSPDKLEELGLDYAPTSIITSQHINKTYDSTSTIYLNDLITGWDKMEETSMIIISALIFFAVILVVVILYNLNILSFTEMEHEITTLKVLGFKSTSLTKILETQSLSFIIIGFILGVPIGNWILSLLIPAFGNNFYLLPKISLGILAITFAIIISTSIITNLFFSRKIKKLNIADSLKDLER
ncbi:MAG: FtsX-like permease family protein [Methanosphaera sp.]|nr:FtsX-like permease family protein [Methanosphaera sp.]